jgi:hypothetical protein
MRTRVATTTTTTTASRRPESRTTELLLQAQHTSLQCSNALLPGNKKKHTHTQTHKTSATPATTKQGRDPTKNKKNKLNKEKLADKCST